MPDVDAAEFGSVSSVVSHAFPKGKRLLKRGEFLRLSQQGRRFSGKVLSIQWMLSTRGRSRLGVTVSKKFGDSPERNRFKRHVREAFRCLSPHYPIFVESNVRPKGVAPVPFNLVFEDMQAFFQMVSRGCNGKLVAKGCASS